MRRVEDPLQVDGDQAIPERRVAVDEEVQPLPAGVVDEDVDRPERALERRDRAADGRAVGDVGGRTRSPPARCPDLRRDRLGGRAVEVEDPDGELVAPEPQRDGPADAAAPSGDERDGAHAATRGSAAPP